MKPPSKGLERETTSVKCRRATKKLPSSRFGAKNSTIRSQQFRGAWVAQ